MSSTDTVASDLISNKITMMSAIVIDCKAYMVFLKLRIGLSTELAL